MAKKRAASEPTKGQQIEQYLSEHPDATPTQIVNGLAEQGVSVSMSMANNVKSKLRSGRRKKAVRRETAASAATADNGLSAKDLFEAKRLADELGGIKQARQALEMLEKLQ